MQENLTIVRRLLCGETVTIDGGFNTLRNSGSLLLRCSGHIPRSGSVEQTEGDRPGSEDGFPLTQRRPGIGGCVRGGFAEDGRDPKDLNRRAAADLRRPDPRTGLGDRRGTVALHGIRLLEWSSEANNAGLRAGDTPRIDEIIRTQAIDFFGEPAMVGTPEDVIDQIEDYRAR